MHNIFRTREGQRTSNTDGAQRPVLPTSAVIFKVKGQGRKVTYWSVWQLLAYMSRTKSPRNTKIGGMVAHTTVNNAHQVREVKKSKLKITRLINTETESVSLTNSKLGRRLEHAVSTVLSWSAIKAWEVWILHRAEAYRIGRTWRTRTLF